MNIFITGGTGFIGSRLAFNCLQLGHNVKVFAQINSESEAKNEREIRNAGGEVVIGSITDMQHLKSAIQNTDLVFHLAAIQHEMNIPDQVFHDVNVTGTRNLMEACLDAGVSKVVHGSTIGVYGGVNGILDESSPCRPDNIYGVTKFEGERVAFSYRDRISVVIIRIPETYGPGDRRLLKLLKLIQKTTPLSIGDGKNEHHMIYVDDLVEGFLISAENPNSSGNIYVFAGPEPISTNDIVDTAAKHLNPGRPRIRFPLLPIVWMAAVVEHICRPIGIQPPLHQRRIDFFRKSYHFSTLKAKSELNFSPSTGFEQGLLKTIRWYHENGHLSGSNSDTSPQVDARQSIKIDPELTAQIEPFDTFWEAPKDIEKGYAKFGKFYKRNYFRYITPDKSARILIISCGTGYFIEVLKKEGYTRVLGIDSDQEKIDYAKKRGLNCECTNAFGFLKNRQQDTVFDLVIAEQELNHLTKHEMITFLRLCHSILAENGKVIVHALNGANPITGSEALAQNFDHYNTFTTYSLEQILKHTDFSDIQTFPLNLYVFYENPLNYIGIFIDKTLNLIFRICFIFYGKNNEIFSKKIGAVAVKR